MLLTYVSSYSLKLRWGAATFRPKRTISARWAGAPSVNGQDKLPIPGSSVPRKKTIDNRCRSLCTRTKQPTRFNVLRNGRRMKDEFDNRRGSACSIGNNQRERHPTTMYSPGKGVERDELDYGVKRDPIIVSGNGWRSTTVHSEHEMIDQIEVKKLKSHGKCCRCRDRSPPSRDLPRPRRRTVYLLTNLTIPTIQIIRLLA